MVIDDGGQINFEALLDVPIEDLAVAVTVAVDFLDGYRTNHNLLTRPVAGAELTVEQRELATRLVEASDLNLRSTRRSLLAATSAARRRQRDLDSVGTADAMAALRHRSPHQRSLVYPRVIGHMPNLGSLFDTSGDPRQAMVVDEVARTLNILPAMSDRDSEASALILFDALVGSRDVAALATVIRLIIRGYSISSIAEIGALTMEQIESIRSELADLGAGFKGPAERTSLSLTESEVSQLQSLPSGLTATIAAPLSSVSEDQGDLRDLVSDLDRDLTALGFEVIAPLTGEPQSNAFSSDLTISLTRGPSLRAGQLAYSAATAGAATLVLDIGDGAKRKESYAADPGLFSVRYPPSIDEARYSVVSFVALSSDKLQARARWRKRAEDRLAKSYGELRRRVVGPDNRPDDYIVSSFEVFLSTSIGDIAELRSKVGLAPVGDLEELFDDPQLWALDNLVSLGEIPDDARGLLLEAAARELVATSMAPRARGRSFARPDDWLSLFLQAQAPSERR